MLFNSLKKTKLFFSDSANKHRVKLKIELNSLNRFYKLNKYFKKHKEIYKNKAKLIDNLNDLNQCKDLLYKKLLPSGIIADDIKLKENTHDFYFQNLKVIGLKHKKNMLSAAKIFFDDSLTIPAQNIIPEQLNLLRKKGYQLVEMSPIAIKEDCIKDKIFKANNNNLYEATIIKTFCGVLNHIYQFSNASHVILLTTKADKEIYEYIGFKVIKENVKASHFPNASLYTLCLDINKFLSTADKNITSYLCLINFEILKKKDSIKYNEKEVENYFTENPFITNNLSSLEKEALINTYPCLKNIFYLKIMDIRNTSYYRKETMQFLVENSLKDFKN